MIIDIFFSFFRTRSPKKLSNKFEGKKTRKNCHHKKALKSNRRVPRKALTTHRRLKTKRIILTIELPHPRPIFKVCSGTLFREIKIKILSLSYQNARQVNNNYIQDGIWYVCCYCKYVCLFFVKLYSKLEFS